ncbi:MAG TPA: DUF2167 domain-containing protein [Candidatus Limnocylindria bacterium]|jgi:uncharacterized membrane-anchored protein|nr:DUF2167 domain-containing protein [Candidatus Limnocylindria bacterium]
MKALRILFTLVFVCGRLLAAGDHDSPADIEKLKAEVQKFLGHLKPKQGKVDLKSGLATANIPPQFYLLGSDDAEKVLTKLWGNPPGDTKPLGLLYPTNESLLSTNLWAVVIRYQEDGYVKDTDANSINYDQLLKEMQDGTKAANEERTKKGYPAIDLVGWAAPPRYDAATHKMYWAKEIKFGDSDENTLNYNLRVLGRKGVLTLNVIAAMSRLKDVEEATPEILAMVDFNDGHRYTDFKPGSDKVATYGIAALVAGGVAAKMGLFKGLLVALLAAKKFIVLAVVAAFGFIKKLFTGRRSNTPEQ